VGEFFDPGRELALFAGVDEAREKIRYYLAHDGERRAIAARGQRRAHAEHTYDHRLGPALERLAARDGRLLGGGAAG